MQPADTNSILNFLARSERLKTELRHSWLSDGRRESVAEHTWQMALMALLTHRHLAQPVDIGHTLKLILVHDLVEIEAGDVPFFETGDRKAAKAAREAAAIETIRAAIGGLAGQEVHDLWHEYEARATQEARFAGALDHLEVQIQHNLADLATWEPVEHGLVYSKMDGPCGVDPFLAVLCEAVKARAEAKLRAGGVDVAAVKAEVAAKART
ncbi:HD domain-containing protein [Desertibaculum subflavum]|uniref:HD domain-containing protein n=1 Tax=Desertibaculum subflavum TaxID=2268458 RepID=UPI000E66ED53